MVGDVHGTEDPYRNGLSRVVAGKTKPLLILADTTERSRRLLGAAAVEFIASTAFLGAGIMLVVIWSLIGA